MIEWRREDEDDDSAEVWNSSSDAGVSQQFSGLHLHRFSQSLGEHCDTKHDFRFIMILITPYYIYKMFQLNILLKEKFLFFI